MTEYGGDKINWLLIPTLLIAILMFAFGRKSIRLCRNIKNKLLITAAYFFLGIPGYLMALYYLHLFDNYTWFYEFRSLPFIELTAAGAGLFAGALAEHMKKSRLFSLPFLIAILCIGISVPYIKPLIAPVNSRSFFNNWDGDVCLQSTSSSCGAASAATVFRYYGIHLTEQEIAEECHTYSGGTEIWYIARAFRSRGFNVNFRIENDFPDNLHIPVIAGVRIGSFGHFIAISAYKDRNYIVGDPLIGHQMIPEKNIASAFCFTGFFMEIKKLDDSEKTSEKFIRLQGR